MPIDTGLQTTCGSYRALLKLFNLPASDYKRFHAFLYARKCNLPVARSDADSPGVSRSPARAGLRVGRVRSPAPCFSMRGYVRPRFESASHWSLTRDCCNDHFFSLTGR